MNNSRDKFRLTIIAIAVTLLVGLVGVNLWRAFPPAKDTMSQPHGSQTYSQADPAVHIGGPFSLIDQDGKPVTEAVLKDKWTAIFFGYTFCPDVCPLTLQNLARTKALLGDKGKDLQIIFFTVDPARDTPAALKAYLNSNGFPKNVIGLTGSPDAIDRAEKAYRIVAIKSGDKDNYTYSHTSVVYLMNPQGEFAVPLTASMTAQQNADQIRAAMNGN